MRRTLGIFGVLLAGYLLTGVAQVRPGERAVVRRFGRVVAYPGPGLWVGLPYGMDRVDRVPVNFVRRLTVGYRPDETEAGAMPAGQLLTGDQNLVNVQVVLDYDVRDDETGLADFVAAHDRAESVLTRAAEAALSEWVAAHNVDEVLLTGKVALRTWLVARVQGRVEGYRLGVAVRAATVAYLAPPDEVKPAFDNVTIAQAGIRTREQQARQQAARDLREAQAEKTRLERQAAADVQNRRRAARTDAAAFLARLEQYHRLRRDNPEILTAIWWSEMAKVFEPMRARGRVDLLDNHLGADGLDITQFARPRKK